jgi:hemolysin III
MQERLNALTHGVGAVLALAGLVVLTVAASVHGSAWHVVSFAVFGGALLLLYLISTLYHSFGEGTTKNVFQRLDHAAIYVLIAASYTPFTLVVLHGAVGWTVFGIVWSLAVIGIVCEQLCVRRMEILVTTCFVLMGWLAVLVVKPLVATLPAAGIAWLVVGGVLYTVGAVIYLAERLPYNHAVWHVFVLGGSASHFIVVLLYVLPLTVA